MSCWGQVFTANLKIGVMVTGLLVSHCALLDKTAGVPESPPADPLANSTRFSSSPRLPAVEQRDYVRMTRERLEREAELGPQAGSMWVMEGQGAYLFSQNKTRQEGDIVNIRLEGSQLKQAQTKLSVVKKLLEQLDQEGKKLEQRLSPGLSNKVEASAERTPAEADAGKKEDEKMEFDLIPARITEKRTDGSYRISGQYPVMVGQRQFKVLVAGLLRSEDYVEEGTSSVKLLESEIDVLSVRKKKGEE